MNMRRRLLAAMVAGTVGRPREAIAADEDGRAARPTPGEGSFPSLDGATAWLNSPPLSPAGLRGKVVMADFCTYTCINWLRSLPYVRAWASKYAGRGLVTIGVHTPEFAFEKDIDNVRRATAAMNVGYPLALDNDYAIWNAFRNEYWPALYLIDARGRVRHHRFGEGDYEQTERVIQQLLAEAGSAGSGRDRVSVDAKGIERAADWRNLRSEENYVGYGRTERFASPGGIVRDRRHAYAVPTRLRLGEWALAGDWTLGERLATANAPEARIACRFHARDLHLVMGLAAGARDARFRIAIDGRPPGADHGIDVDAEGNGTIVQPRLYQLVRQAGAIDDRVLEVAFLDPGIEAWSFTFG